MKSGNKHFNEKELKILEVQQFVKIDKEEIALLKSGQASIKTQNKAEKALHKYVAWLQMPMPRQDIMQFLVNKDACKTYRAEIEATVHCLGEALIRKGVITQEDILKVKQEIVLYSMANKMQHLCDLCIYDPVRCFVDPEQCKTVQDIHPEINYPIQKVIQCEKLQLKEGVN